MIFRTLVVERNLYKKYVEVLNNMFLLAEREMDIFAALLRVHIEWGTYTPKDITDTRSRKQVMQETLVNKNNLSKYLGNLKDKKILVYNGDKTGWVINSNLVPTIIDNEISIGFAIKVKDE